MSYHEEQLCWTCQNARADRCSWIGCHKKVKGWVAEIIPCVDSTKPNKIGETYSIRECPNYLKDTPKLSKTGYVEKLAKELGISVTTLYRRMRKSENV